MMESVSPNIFVTDLKKTIGYYESLGLSLSVSFPEAGEPVFAMMTCGKVTFMFQRFDSLGSELPDISRNNGGSLLLYIQMKGIRALHERIKDKVTMLKGLEKTFYGATEFSIRDVNNYVLTFAEDEPAE